MLNHNHDLKLVSHVIFRDRVSSEFPVKTVSLSSLITALCPPCASPKERCNVLTSDLPNLPDHSLVDSIGVSQAVRQKYMP